jgi:hypothetical protein
MDPAALGTLTIGLESVRLEEDLTRSRRRSRTTGARSSRPVAQLVAAWLRAIADRFDQPSVIRTDA